jgi:predicted AlkP superfamily phosphohydrolase/phosphomutase
VVLISWDGSRTDLIYQFMQDGTMPTFAALADAGVQAEYAQSIDPSLTAAAHNSMSSGCFPTFTGITSNSFHVTGDDFYWYRRGFDETMDQAEPIWVTASKNGLRTAAVFFVGGSPSHEGQEADYTIGYGIQDAYSDQRNVELISASSWLDVPISYSPSLEGSMTIQNVEKIFLYVLDSTDDSLVNYDTVVINTDRSGREPAQILKQHQWGSLVLLPRSYAGAEFLVQEITPQSVTLFHSAVSHNSASPVDFLKAVNENFGFFRSGADSYALEHRWITEEDFMYLLERQSSYMAEIAAWVYRTYHPDLMLTWQDPLDSAGHQFLMLDPRQLDYSPEKAEAFAGFYKQAAMVADQSLQTMLNAFDLEKTTLMLVGDHGMAPIHSIVYVNTILEQAGLLTLDSQNYVVVDKTKVFAIPSGGAVHIYINLEGREKGGGTVSEAEYPEIQETIIQLLTAQLDPSTGEPVFQRVLGREDLASIGLDHPNSGDVFAQANPGYHLDGWRGNDFIFQPADFYGQHGYDSSLPEMHTIFISAGAGIPRMNELILPVRIVDYAPTIAALLSFQPAKNVQGSLIPGLFLP